MLPVSASTTSWRSAQFSPIARLSSRFPRTSSSGLSHAPVTAAGVGGRQSKSFHRGEVSRSNARRQRAGNRFRLVRTRRLFPLPRPAPRPGWPRPSSILNPPSSPPISSRHKPQCCSSASLLGAVIIVLLPASQHGQGRKKASGQPAATAHPPTPRYAVPNIPIAAPPHYCLNQPTGSNLCPTTSPRSTTNPP